MWSILALGAAQRLINGMIDLDAISRIQLNRLQGKMLRVVIASPQLSVDVLFDEGCIRLEPTVTGQAAAPSIFEQRPYDAAHIIHPATTTLSVANLVELLKLLLSDSNELGTIPLQGDYHLLFELQGILAQMQPDLAAHLSPWIGPALAHEIGKIQAIPKALHKTAQSQWFWLQDALKEDSGLLAPRWKMQQLQDDTRQLNQDIDRLEARIQQRLAEKTAQD